jgi:hypothetical protein
MSKRNLDPNEQGEAILVFGKSLDYSRVVVHENVRWTNWIGCIGAWLRSQPPPGANAVTLLNHIFFPRNLRGIAAGTVSPAVRGDMGWLIHELTHVWQYQNIGLWYVLRTVWLHLRARSDIYSYGGGAALMQHVQKNSGFLSFNQEQQGEITRDYYLRLKKNTERSAWVPFIEEIQGFER